jgi:glycosyltransferase involved in cell wall biosynthesis
LAAPLVSVCIPTYNSAATVSRCLESVLSQHGVDFELLVVDDDSDDETVSAARELLRRGDRLVVNGSRLGLVGNHNRCLELARGTYVQFVHADDLLLPSALSTLAAELENSNGGMAFAPRLIDTDEAHFVRRFGQLHTNFRGLRERNNGCRLVKQMVARGIHHNWIGEPTSVMFRRDLAVEAGGFRDDIYQLLDLDLWLRLMVRSTVCFVPRALSVRFHNAETESARNKACNRDWLDQLRVITSMVVDPAAPFSIRVGSSMWWVLIWVRSLAEAVAFGPGRSSRLKVAVLAPVAEFGRARERLRPRPSLDGEAG